MRVNPNTINQALIFFLQNPQYPNDYVVVLGEVSDYGTRTLEVHNGKNEVVDSVLLESDTMEYQKISKLLKPTVSEFFLRRHTLDLAKWFRAEMKKRKFKMSFRRFNIMRNRMRDYLREELPLIHGDIDKVVIQEVSDDEQFVRQLRMIGCTEEHITKAKRDYALTVLQLQAWLDAELFTNEDYINYQKDIDNLWERIIEYNCNGKIKIESEDPAEYGMKVYNELRNSVYLIYCSFDMLHEFITQCENDNDYRFQFMRRGFIYIMANKPKGNDWPDNPIWFHPHFFHN